MTQHHASARDRHNKLCQDLRAAWPSQSDIDTICTLEFGVLAHFTGGISTRFSQSLTQEAPALQETLRLPPQKSHPVLIARRLLTLALYLQVLVPGTPNLGYYHGLMHSAVDTAIRLVTTNEDVVCSVEGIECIMMEALFHNYSGNLHRAWMAVRRAIMHAQIMALHRSPNPPSLKILEPETRASFDADEICFKLVLMDHYLSLMLGLPPTDLEARFTRPEALEKCQPVDRMHRIRCIASGRILRRKTTNDYSETKEIEALFNKADAELPAQWWLMPRFAPSGNAVEETRRLMDQLANYHMLIQLHLPFVFHCQESKFIAANSSREVLIRFITLCTANAPYYYCRGIDFLVFTSTTVLCLVHSDTRNNVLNHSRLADRGLMERTLEIMESKEHTGSITGVLRRLLDIEANASGGMAYSASSSEDNVENHDLEYHGNATDDGKGLEIHIPHFGTIRFQPSGLEYQVDHQIYDGMSHLDSGVFGDDVTNKMSGPMADWGLQGVDFAMFDSLFRGIIDDGSSAQWLENSDSLG